MHALVNVGACLNLEPAQRAKHDLRHLRCRSVVEVMQSRVHETWKFALDRSRIEALIRFAQLHRTLPLRDRRRRIAALISNAVLEPRQLIPIESEFFASPARNARIEGTLRAAKRNLSLSVLPMHSP